MTLPHLDGTFSKIASQDAILGLQVSLSSEDPQSSYDPISKFRIFNGEKLRAEAHYWTEKEAGLMKSYLEELGHNAQITYSKRIGKHIVWSNFYPKYIDMYPFWIYCNLGEGREHNV